MLVPFPVVSFVEITGSRVVVERSVLSSVHSSLVGIVTSSIDCLLDVDVRIMLAVEVEDSLDPAFGEIDPVEILTVVAQSSFPAISVV